MPRTEQPSATGKRPAHAVLQRGELSRVVLAGSAFFCVLCSYYLLRPVRDAMAVQFGAGKLQWLFSATLLFTLAIVPLFGYVVRRLPRRHVLPAVYGFVILNLLGFYLAFVAGPGRAVAAAFFVWLSVFNLFVVSLFWSKTGDCFSTDESHRLYGYIAAGGTAGALSGPALTAFLAHRVETSILLVLSALLLGVAIACMSALQRHRPDGAGQAARPLGGSVLAGIALVLKSPTLRSLAFLVICYTTVSTVLYVELVDLAGKRYASAGERTAFFAKLDLAVNIAALLLQLIGTRQLVQRWGLRVALPAAPLVVMTGLIALAGSAWLSLRTAASVAAVQVLHRAGEFAFSKPGREMVYTAIDAESRYKAKNFIDTAVYRASDASAAWLTTAVRAAGMDAIALAAIPAALAWAITAYLIGRRHDGNQST